MSYLVALHPNELHFDEKIIIVIFHKVLNKSHALTVMLVSTFTVTLLL